jgi:hypothetical protein
MTVLGFSARTLPEKLVAAGARAVFDDMTKLPSSLAQYGALTRAQPEIRRHGPGGSP